MMVFVRNRWLLLSAAIGIALVAVDILQPRQVLVGLSAGFLVFGLFGYLRNRRMV